MCGHIGFTIFCVIELQSIDYGIGATPSEEGFDPIKAAMVRVLCFEAASRHIYLC